MATVNEYVSEYEYRGDRDYKPNEHEQAMIEDAIEGYLTIRPRPKEFLALMVATTVSSIGNEISIACPDHNTKDALMAILSLNDGQYPQGRMR